MRPSPELVAAWLEAWPRGAAQAARAAAEAASDPWQAVAEAGWLARCEPVDGRPRPVAQRRALGAWDTPRHLAEELVGLTRERGRGLDPSCGSGALLLAMHQAGVRELVGVEIDPVVAAVARVAVPSAELRVADAFAGLPEADLILSNPPFVASEAQDKVQRAALRRRMPWLQGRFDLAVPFLACLEAPELALVCPVAVLRQNYAAELRARWLTRYRVAHLQTEQPFPGAGVRVALTVLREGPDQESSARLRLPGCVLDPRVGAAEVALMERMRADCGVLGDHCEVDTGVVAHGPLGGKERLLHATPGPGRVPYVDAQDLLSGRRRWLQYEPTQMHRAKRPALFLGPKLLVQRLGTRRATVDRSGLYAGHTLTVVRPLPGCPYTLEQLKELIESPLSLGLLRIERGLRLDLYPRDLRRLAIPHRWPEQPLERAFGLSPRDSARLRSLSEP